VARGEPRAGVALAPVTTPARFGPRGFLGALLFVVALFVIAKTLAAFAATLPGYLAVHYDYRLEIGMVSGQILFQWAFLWRRPREQKLSYAWILVAVSAMGAMLLWPLLFFVPGASPMVAVAYFFGVVAIMFVVHWLLVSRYAMPKWLCATWVVYRLFLLAVLVRWR
jgi:hypothetical protein